MTEIQQIILDWFLVYKRDLPWRNTKNPYYIWLSEVILQQTRVVQGMSYYHKFISHYPTIFDLYKAPEQEVLSDWQGLGYYSRARNLHAAAKQICEQNNGSFPQSFEEIKKLKGVGDYTAAAIASFAFNLPHAVVDGNVYRVLSRLFDIDLAIDSTRGKKVFQNLADELLNKIEPGLHNQAMMEFGALQCVPVKPNCEICPLAITCISYKNKTVSERPVKKGKTKVRNRYFLYFIWFDKKEQSIALRFRKEKDIWQNMFEFPKIELTHLKELEKYIHDNKNGFLNIITWQKHILSHQHIHATFVIVNSVDNLPKEEMIQVKWDKLSDYPLPRLIDRFLEHHSELILA